MREKTTALKKQIATNADQIESTTAQVGVFDDQLNGVESELRCTEDTLRM